MLKKKVIKICLGSSCFSRGNNNMISYIQKYLRTKRLEDKVEFSGDHCCNRCSEGPIIRISGKVFQQVNIETIDNILNIELKDIL